MKHLKAVLQKNLELYQPHTVPRRAIQRVIDDLEGACPECGKPMFQGDHVQQCLAPDHEISMWKTPPTP